LGQEVRVKNIPAGLLLILCLSASANEQSWISKRGLFVVTYQSELEPLQINELHAWVLHIENPQGEAITNARIEVDGGMPEHNHGLATRPRVTAETGGGNYRLDGLRFHMHGNWELLLTIVANGKTDTVKVQVTL
jgi:hypothetical protein